MQQITAVPWGHPSLPAAAVLLTPSPVPSPDAANFDAIRPARARFASLGARFELVPSTLGGPESTLVLPDGYGEIFALWTNEERASWPDATELMEWLDYVASQCPECSPAEPAWRETVR